MYLAERTKILFERFLQSYGPSSVKRLLWDREFAGNKWDFINHTEGDCVYENLEKYANNGNILDLGCGPGNTANELAIGAYQRYVGVDISENALAKGRVRTEREGRTEKNTFVQGDFINYVPGEKFDVILFRESMYHVPMGKIKPTLDRLSAYLKDNGAFVIRMYTADGDTGGKEKPRPNAMFQLMEKEFQVVEKRRYEGDRHPTVLVLRPRRRN
jgi:SAM-dependent methyltransferase